MTTGLGLLGSLYTLLRVIQYFLPTHRVPKVSALQEMYTEVGFTKGPAIVLTSLCSKPEQYYNKEGPFNKDWRNTDRYT